MRKLNKYFMVVVLLIFVSSRPILGAESISEGSSFNEESVCVDSSLTEDSINEGSSIPEESTDADDSSNQATDVQAEGSEDSKSTDSSSVSGDEQNSVSQNCVSTVEAEQDTDLITLNETNFPDEVFRHYLEEKFGSNGYVNKTCVLSIDLEVPVYNAQTQSITDFLPYTYNGKTIQSLEGLQYFTNLTFLRSTEEDLTSLDISKNTKLQKNGNLRQYNTST